MAGTAGYKLGGSMAYFSPEEAFDKLKDSTSKTVNDYFPIEGKKNILVAKKVWAEDDKSVDDIQGQLDARLKGRTWAVPVKAELELRDKETGKVRDRKTVTVAQLPKVTRRFTYIVDGNEWQLNNQFRLKSGVYTRVKNNGDLASQWNLEKGMGFSMNFNPKSRKMSLGYGTANVALYPVLKTMGISDDDIEKNWGKEVLAANRKVSSDAEIRKLYKSMTGKVAESLEEAKGHIAKTFGDTSLRPDSTKLTLGKPYDKVDGSSLLAGANRLLSVARQESNPDDRDSLQFKDFYSAEDLVEERLRKDARWDINRRMKNTVDKRNKIESIVTQDVFQKPLKKLFTNSTLSERPDSRNPVAFTVGARKTTVMGEHGIDDEQKLTISAQSINPSHLGFIDPIHTPVGSKKIGAIIQLSSDARKVGKDLRIPVTNVKTGKKELISPDQALRSNLAFNDQFKDVGGKLTPRFKKVSVANKAGDVEKIDPKEVDYVLSHTRGQFDLAPNLIPFLQNDQGNRAMVAAGQLEQAVPLVNREAPLVQSKGGGKLTYEEALGHFNSHHSPVDGTVERVGADGIVVRGADGKKHSVQTYNDFPLNDNKSLISSHARVKKGDSVKRGEVLADSSFTDNGTLALGTNLNVAYMPWHGLNFEDATVISESASKKLTSEHMHRHSSRMDKNVILNKNKFLAETAGQYTKEQAEKLDEDGVIKPGSAVNPGDVLIGEMRKEELTPEQKQLALFSKKAARPVRARPSTWEKEYPGTVSRVVKHGKDVTVYVKTNTPAEVGDKLVGRHANKAIISQILPDHEMPHTSDGRRAEILLNPAGVPGRINLGQVLETAAAKIAVKDGKPYKVSNFDPDNKDYTRNLMNELKSKGLSDTEEMFDPQTGKSFGQIMTGPQYILKLHHTAEKGLVARSRGPYTSNLTPQGGGTTGGQTMDTMALYALLAHGARENIREAQTIRSDKNDEIWNKIQTGESIPAPKVPFVYKKFEDTLRASGVDVKKKGAELHLGPLTDKGTLKLSNGELKKPGLILKAKDATPEKGGLFDPDVTGTKWPKGELGDKWSHITLAERMPNPTFERPISSLLGMTEKDFTAVVSGSKDIDGKKGPTAIVSALTKVNVDKDLAEAESQISNLRGSALDKVNKKIRYLRALKESKMNPTEAYTMKYVPVLPPSMRPISVLPNGDLSQADLNDIYSKGVGVTNDQVKTFPKELPKEDRLSLDSALYDGLRALNLTGMKLGSRHRSGILEQITGGAKGSPKEGFFQKKVIGRRQDMSMRGTIVPDPSLSLDEVALPRKAAAEIYKPFVVSRISRMAGVSPLEAQRHVKEDTAIAQKALELETKERPVLLKRDPVLHKYGVQAFTPVLVPGKVIKIHPLVTGGYGADFDGDKMSAYVPISQKAVVEARKMMPSHNLLSPSTGELMYKPGHEATMGLFDLTKFGKRTNKAFRTAADAARAVKDGVIGLNDLVEIEAPEGLGPDLSKISAQKVKTSVGRLMVYNALPDSVKDPSFLTDPKQTLDKDKGAELLERIARTSKSDYAKTADYLKDMGNYHSTGKSFGLKDFTTDLKIRDRVLAVAEKEEEKVRKSKKPQEWKNKEIVKVYMAAGKALSDGAKKQVSKEDNRMFDWVKSGARGSWDQFRQIAVAPMLVVDSTGRPIPVPITKSYAEGLDAPGYWNSMHGARTGTIAKVLETEKPGATFKQMVNTSMDQLVVSDDCGTSKGITINPDDPNILDRHLAKEVNLGKKGGQEKGIIPAGTLITSEIQSRLRNNKVKDVLVRTPLKCAHGEGICAKCMGLNEEGKKYEKGTNVGIIAAQALGEPSTQLSLKVFHEGGTAGSKGAKALHGFARLEQLTMLPKILPGAATLAEESGKVEKIEKDPAGGWGVTVSGHRHFIPGQLDLSVKKGDTVRKGDQISTGVKNPHQMLPLTGLGSVQRYLTEEMDKVYSKESPIHRRNIEVFVRSMTNLGVVNDPGSDHDTLRGDVKPASEMSDFNSKLKPGDKPVRYTPVLKGANIVPLEQTTDWLARLQTTRLKDTVLEGVARGWKSKIHGPHPVPAMALGAAFGEGTKEEPWLY